MDSSTLISKFPKLSRRNLHLVIVRGCMVIVEVGSVFAEDT